MSLESLFDKIRRVLENEPDDADYAPHPVDSDSPRRYPHQDTVRDQDLPLPSQEPKRPEALDGYRAAA